MQGWLSNPTVPMIIGGSLGIVTYLASCLRRKVPPTADLVFESCIFGGMTVVGLHLFLCVIFPENLVHYADAVGNIHHPPQGFEATIGHAHILELLAGSGVATFIGGKSWLSVCRLKKIEPPPVAK